MPFPADIDLKGCLRVKKFTSWDSGLSLLLLIALLMMSGGCQGVIGGSWVPNGEALRQAIETWNPTYIKVIEIYGVYFPTR